MVYFIGVKKSVFCFMEWSGSGSFLKECASFHFHNFHSIIKWNGKKRNVIDFC